MFEEFNQKHLQALLPTSPQSYNYLVDNAYHLDAEKFIQFADGSEQIAAFIKYFLGNISEYSKKYDLTKFYDQGLDFELLIESLNVDQSLNVLFNRIDLAFSNDNLKLLECNINKPTTFSEQIYDQLKNNHNKLEYQLNKYFANYKQPTTIGFVVENEKDDTISSFFALKKLINNSNINLVLVENKNIIIEQDGVYLFDKDTKALELIYYVPYEKIEYSEQMRALTKLHNQKKLKMLSAPGTIFVQAKGFHALTTKLLDDDMLPAEQARIVNKYFLKSWIIDTSNLKQIISEKDKYIFKPVFGRTSTGVFIGKAVTNHQIEEFFAETSELYIAQELVEIRSEQLPKHTFGQTTYEMTYPVYSAFMINCDYVQIISRLSKRYITNDGSWTVPIRPIDKIKIPACALNKDIRLTNVQKLDFIFNAGFTGFNIGENEYITNQALIIEDKVLDEMKYVAEQYTKLLIKTQDFIIKNRQKFLGLYSWNTGYIQTTSQIFTILSRVDIIINDSNQIKVLESNVETPAGLVESFELEQKLLSEEQTNCQTDPIKYTLSKRLLEIEDYGQVIGLITLDYYEDMYNVLPFQKVIKQVVSDLGLDIDVEIITVQNLKVKNDKLYTDDNREIKVVYSYFPLDWFSTFPQYKSTLQMVEKLFLSGDLVSLTPNETIISQHKSINAVIYQLLTHNFYTNGEKHFIKKYIPFTAVNGEYFFTRNNKQKPFLTKSTLGREGAGIYINKQFEREVIFQEMENVAMVEFEIANTHKKITKAQGFPVYGIYVSDTSYCGVYTRVSDQITNKNAYYLPLLRKSKVRS